MIGNMKEYWTGNPWRNSCGGARKSKTIVQEFDHNEGYEALFRG